MKVAQYEVLGNGAKRDARPARDDRKVRLLVSHMRHARISNCRSSLPGLNRFFERQPSTSYWATFIVSLRDQSLPRISLPFILTHMGQSPG